MTRHPRSPIRPLFFAACLFHLLPTIVAAVEDHRVVLKIDREVKITPAGATKRAMMSMVRHPDGTIFLNAQTERPRLYKSSDAGETWTAVPIRFTGLPAPQETQGLGVNRNGRLFVIHQSPDEDPDDRLYGQSLYVSYSDDGARTWTTSQTNFGDIPPRLPNMQFHEDGNRTFIEQPDGTLMFTTTIVPSPKYGQKTGEHKQPFRRPNYQYGGTPLDFFSDVILRSYDGGETWGDPSRVYPQLNPHESALAIDPHDGDHILLMSRIQSSPKWHTAAQKKELMRRTGNPKPLWKQAALFESTDGGRTFHMPDGGFTEWYGHRATICWSKNDVVVVTGAWGGPGETRRAVRVSLDGGKRWVNGTKSGTPRMSEATKLELGKAIGFTSPTIELSKNRFLTAMFHYGHIHGVPEEWKSVVGAVFWHLEETGE